MSYADPQTVTINSVPKVLNRVKTDGFSAIYQAQDESFKLTISHQKSNKRIRSMVRLDQRSVVADPITSVNDYETIGAYFVVDRPEVGFSLLQTQQLIAGFQAWLDAAAAGKLYGQES